MDAWKLIREKVERCQYFERPQPGVRFSYEDWKAGRNTHKAIVDMIEGPHFIPGLPQPKRKGPSHERYTIRIQDAFREQSLQVVVKIGGIELEPANPNYLGGTWQLEGHLNEHIVATAMYVYDASNFTPCHIEHRQETPIWSSIYRYESRRGMHCKLDPPSMHRINIYWRRLAFCTGRHLRSQCTRLGSRFAPLCSTIPNAGSTRTATRTIHCLP